MKATYVRVSTFEQNISRQIEGKEGEVYWDKVSGTVPFEDREDAGRLLAEIDYNNRREAQREGIARARAEGKYNGRANESGLSDVDLIEEHSDIVGESNKGEAMHRTAKHTGRSTNTVQRVRKALYRLEVAG